MLKSVQTVCRVCTINFKFKFYIVKKGSAKSEGCKKKGHCRVTIHMGDCVYSLGEIGRSIKRSMTCVNVGECPPKLKFAQLANAKSNYVKILD